MNVMKKLTTAIVFTFILALLAVPLVSANDSYAPPKGTRIIPGGSEVIKDDEVASWYDMIMVFFT